MLWKIENTPHKVLGSIHALPDGQSLPAWFSEACASVSRLVFEADHTDTSFLEIGVDREGKHLDWPGAQNLYDKAELLMKAIGNNNPFDGLRPWRASLFVSFALIGSTLKVHPSNGIEVALRSHAQQHGKSVGFLESPARAFELFDSCNEPYAGLRLFQHLLSDPSSAIKEYSRILNAWLASDIGEMSAVHAERMFLFPQVFQPLITQRNREWLPVAADMIRSEIPTLFVVGCLHTVGPHSFINGINSLGYNCVFHEN